MQIESKTATALVISTPLVQVTTTFVEQLLFGQPKPEGHELAEHALIDYLRDAGAVTTEGHVDHYEPEAAAVLAEARDFLSRARAHASHVAGRAHFDGKDAVAVTLLPAE